MKPSQTPSAAYPGEVREVLKKKYPTLAAKVADMDTIIKQFAHNPMIHEYAVEVVRSAGAPPRDYMAQIGALLSEVQGWYYVNEPNELFFSPLYMIRHQAGDCDDLVMALGALLGSISIPSRVEHIEWSDLITHDPRAHVYLKAGVPPKAPTYWIPLETTRRVPVGFDPREFLRTQGVSV